MHVMASISAKLLLIPALITHECEPCRHGEA